MKTKNQFQILVLLALFLGFTSCSSDDDEDIREAIQTVTVENLHAPQTGGQGEPVGGEFTKFDFTTGMVTDSETEWDIAFRGTTIAVNGGTATGTNDEPERNAEAAATFYSGTMASLTSTEDLTFVQDSESGFAIPAGSDNGWYNYNFLTNVVSKIPGKILVFRTRDNRYAKVEIISYYLDAPENPDGFADEARYYTFDYVYNPNEGDTTFE
jgi:hypothetical protein